MPISYEKLFKLMEQKGITKYKLRQQGLSPTLINKMVKGENINTSTIIEVCKLLDCQPGDIMEYVPDEEAK